MTIKLEEHFWRLLEKLKNGYYKMNKLAIVIPAYKSDFISATIDSIINQTCSNFNLYIGIDGPINETIEALKPYDQDKKIQIKIFEENIGSKDLVAQWVRCINITENEEYIWLFPDDDLMSSNCVESFYMHLQEIKSKPCLLRFNNFNIDSQDKPITERSNLPLVETGDSYILARYINNRRSSLAEHIFSREVYDKYGIINFPAAWGSDTISWFIYGNNKPIETIAKGTVMTRQSDKNISNSLSPFNDEKIEGFYLQLEYLMAENFFERNKQAFNSYGTHKHFLKMYIFNRYFILGVKHNMLDILKNSLRNNRLLSDGIFRNFLRLLFYNNLQFRIAIKKLKSTMLLYRN
tara:strand:- start:1682 stop:2731 length:1050 start_codon:yes stop_codon:yes gene_type:complete